MPDRVKEKLVELLRSAYGTSFNAPYFRKHELEPLADHLIANGVKVGKPLEEYLHPIVNYDGLKAKYLVFGATTGKRIVNCFVLRPDKDPAAVEALRAYARFTDNKTLSADIYNWVGEGVTVQQCKVGDTIYEVDGEHGIVKHEVYEVCVVFKTTATDDNGAKWDDFYTTDDIDTAYKTRDEAKASLPQPPKGE